VYNLKYSWNGIKSRIDKMGLNDFSFWALLYFIFIVVLFFCSM
jgi:hypothetical protein